MGTYNSDRKNTRFYGLKLSRSTDAELIAKLDSVDSIQGYIKNLIKNDIKEGKKMTRIDCIMDNYDKICETMVNHYQEALEAAGRTQYAIYIWDDGSLEVECEPAGNSSSWLQPRDGEPRALYYVTTVKGVNPWDCADHPAPEDDAEREAEEEELIDWLVDEYKANIVSTLDTIIEDIRREEQELDEYDRFQAR